MSEIEMRDRFQLDFLQLLDGRLAAIRNNVATHHYEEARIAMLSLEAASGMLGAQSLVDALQDLRAMVDVGPAEVRTTLLARIDAEANSVRRTLETEGGLDEPDSVL